MKIINTWGRMGVILMGGVLIITGCFAPQQTQPPSAEEVIANMKQELQLSEEQLAQITPIMQTHIRQRQEIMEQARRQGLTQEAIQTQIQALRQSTKSKLSQYLTPDQLTQWKNKHLPLPAQK